MTSEEKLDAAVRLILGDDYDTTLPLVDNQLKAVQEIMKGCADLSTLAVAQRLRLLTEHVDKLASDWAKRYREQETEIAAVNDRLDKASSVVGELRGKIREMDNAYRACGQDQGDQGGGGVQGVAEEAAADSGVG